MNTQAMDTTTTVETFLASGERLYAKQRERLQAEEQAYLWQRFKRVREFEERARSLLNERDDALRELDQRWQKTRADGERMLAALAQLREG